MGAQWKHAGRTENSAKRGAMISKLVKEIIVSVKSGGPNPEGNFRLRAAIEAAKRLSVPRDNIERAIKKGSGQSDDAVNFEIVTYEGFAPHQVPLMIECLTDNKNRTASDIRLIFRKGQLGSPGSVSWMFERCGVVEASHPDRSLDLETVAIEVGAQNVESMDVKEAGEDRLGARFYCTSSDLDSVSKALAAAQWVPTQVELSYVPKTPIEVDADKMKEVGEFLDAVDDQDDVHRIYTALK